MVSSFLVSIIISECVFEILAIIGCLALDNSVSAMIAKTPDVIRIYDPSQIIVRMAMMIIHTPNGSIYLALSLSLNTSNSAFQVNN